MKGRNLLITSLIVFVAAAVLIVINAGIKSQDFVVIGGILFIWAGVFNLLIFEADRRRAAMPRSKMSIAFSWISSCAAIILGLIMLFSSSTFIGLVPYIFAIILLVGAAYQVFILAYASRSVKLPNWLYVAPVAMIAGTVYLCTLTAGEDSDPAIMLTTGIALALFGIAGAIEAVMIMRHERAVIAGNAATAEIAEAGASTTPKPLDDTDE